MVGITQATRSRQPGDTGAELRKIWDSGDAKDLRLYIDGAGLANAAAHLDCALAELADCTDVLSFGGTKNGALGGEGCSW